jgi:hypothetical protein
MRWGMVSINVFFVFGFLFLNQIDDYQEAMGRVRTDGIISEDTATDHTNLMALGPIN